MQRLLAILILVALAPFVAAHDWLGDEGVLAASLRPTRPAPVRSVTPTRPVASTQPARSTRTALPAATFTPRPRSTMTIAAVTPQLLTPVLPTLAATVAPVEDPFAALSSCSQGIFGVTLSFTRSGGLTGAVARSLNLPATLETVVAADGVAADGIAVYGIAADRSVAAVVTGSGAGKNADVQVEVSAASLCTVQMQRTQSWPGAADVALAALLTAFPGAPQDADYEVTATTGGYAFAAVTTRPVFGAGMLTTQGVVLAMTKAGSKVLMSALSGTGEYAAEVGDW